MLPRETERETGARPRRDHRAAPITDKCPQRREDNMSLLTPDDRGPVQESRSKCPGVNKPTERQGSVDVQ